MANAPGRVNLNFGHRNGPVLRSWRRVLRSLPLLEYGRGLLIIGTLAERWGQRRIGNRFTVWAETVVERPA